jgi:hypothetical protein
VGLGFGVPEHDCQSRATTCIGWATRLHVPVVSYAPRPLRLMVATSLSSLGIIEAEGAGRKVSTSRRREITSLMARNAVVAQGLTHCSKGVDADSGVSAARRGTARQRLEPWCGLPFFDRRGAAAVCGPGLARISQIQRRVCDVSECLECTLAKEARRCNRRRGCETAQRGVCGRRE